jgi:hypothetical protein
MADKADAAGTPKPYLRNILRNRFDLSDTEDATLLRNALAFRAELIPIHQKAISLQSAYASRFPGRILNQISDRTIPGELADIQKQEDALVLRYRDLLHNDLGEHDFRLLDNKVLEVFSKPLSTTSH